MKRIILSLVFILCTVGVFAQTNSDTVKEGSVLVLNGEHNYYNEIMFPKKNVILKRGAIADFKSLKGEKVIVTSKEEIDGKTIVTLERQNGKKFFQFYPTVKANLDEALDKGELKVE